MSIRLRGFVAAGLALLGALSEAGTLPQVGLTLKGDLVNRIGAPGLKLWWAPHFAMEGYWAGLHGDYDGFLLRGLVVLPAVGEIAHSSLRPYLGVGYARLEQTVGFSGRTDQVRIGGQTFSATTSASARARGSGAQLFAGLQVNPFAALPHLVFETELGYALFEVEGQARGLVEIEGPLGDFGSESRISVKSDYETFSLMVGATYYFL